MTQTTQSFSEKMTQGDLIRYEMYRGYTRVGAVIYNRDAGAVTIADPMAYPLKNDYAVTGAFQLAKAGDEADVTGLLLGRGDGHAASITALASNSKVDYGRPQGVLVRGPAIIDKAVIPTKDYAGSNFTLATIVTALAGLVPPILCNQEPSQTNTQVD